MKPSDASTGTATPPISKTSRTALQALRVSPFFFVVILPTLLVGGYMYLIANPQYHSRVSFSVRSLDSNATASILGMLSATPTQEGEDSLTIYDYLHSQTFVQRLEQRIPLATIYSSDKADYLFQVPVDSTIEEKQDYWDLFSSVTFDNTSKIIDVFVYAFTPEDAQRLSSAVLQESEALVNALSEAARFDAVRFAEQDVKEAEARLKAVRLKLVEFRNVSQVVDPTATVTIQAELVGSLEGTLARTRAQLSTLRSYLGEKSPPIEGLKRQIQSLERQIEQERSKLAGQEEEKGREGGTISSTLAIFEELTVEKEFAETVYTASLTALTESQAQARRSQRYLATHVPPTLAQEPLYPSRLFITFAVFASLLLAWGIGKMLVVAVSSRS